MSKTKRGYLVVCESVEGAGKTLSSIFMAEYFEKIGIDCVNTREPGGTPFAEDIRSMLLQKRDEKVHEQTELLLMFAARAQHLNQVILPSLESGKWVYCQRFNSSSIAYQGAARGMNLKTILDLKKMVCGDLEPDLTIILDIDPEIGMKRASNRGDLDRIETEEIAFFNRARESFLQQARENPHRFAVIDASKSIPEVKEQLKSVMDEFVRKTEKVSNYNSDELSPSV
jgi:dTMP kinase